MLEKDSKWRPKSVTRHYVGVQCNTPHSGSSWDQMSSSTVRKNTFRHPCSYFIMAQLKHPELQKPVCCCIILLWLVEFIVSLTPNKPSPGSNGSEPSPPSLRSLCPLVLSDIQVQLLCITKVIFWEKTLPLSKPRMSEVRTRP